jgi:hypothetical protein
MGADADHHQPLAGLVQRAVLVAASVPGDVGVARLPVGQIGQVDRARLGDLLLGAAADEDRLAQELDGQLRAGGPRRR